MGESGMGGNEILLLGLGLQAPWQLVDQRLEMDKTSHKLHLDVGALQGQSPGMWLTLQGP